MNDNVINIRSLQHFLYCPHRWGLIEIGKVWSENFYVTKANLVHKRAHDFNEFVSKNKKVFTSVSVYNDMPEYNLYGVLDCLEISDNGINIVEYKPSKPKNKEYNYEDLMQVFAQKLCVDYIFNGNSQGYIYYADVKKRVKLPLMENFLQYDKDLKNIVGEMRSLIKMGKIPSVRKDQNCNGCSLKDLCIPKIKKIRSVHDEIAESVRKEEF